LEKLALFLAFVTKSVQVQFRHLTYVEKFAIMFVVTLISCVYYIFTQESP